MKVLISASAPKLESSLDPRFGRAAYFLVVDSDTLEWTALENPAVHASGGAGIQAAQAGAAILHLHARDPQNGKPSRSSAVVGPTGT